MKHKLIFEYNDIVALITAKLQLRKLSVGNVVVSEYSSDATQMTIEVTASDAPLATDECLLCGRTEDDAPHAVPRTQMVPTALDVSAEPSAAELAILHEEQEPLLLDEELGESEEPPEYDHTEEPRVSGGSARAAAAAGKKLAAGKEGPFSRRKLAGPGNIGGESTRPPRPGEGSY